MTSSPSRTTTNSTAATRTAGVASRTGGTAPLTADTARHTPAAASRTADTASPSVGTRTPFAGLRHPAVRRFGIPVGIGILGLLVSLYRIGVPSLWYDEVATVTSATRSWSQLGDMIGTVDAVHALYYALMHVVFDLFGYSPVTLRVPSAVAVGVAAALTVVLARQLAGPRVALLAGLVFCLLPRTTWMGGEGRSYAFTALAAVLLTVVLVHAFRSTRRRWWVLYAALTVLSCVLFIYLALVVVAHAVTLLCIAARPNASAAVKRSARRWTLATTAATLVVVPFALQVMGQSTQLHWLDPLSKDTVEQVVRGQWFTRNWNFAGAGWALLLAGAFLALRPARHTTPSGGGSTTPDARAPRLLGAILIPAVIVPTLLLLAATALYLPIYTPRYLSMCLPFVAVLMAVPIAHLRGRIAPSIVIVALVALAVPQFNAQRQPQAKEFSSWSQVADLIATERAAAGPGSSTAIIYGGVQFHPSATARVISYSYPDAFAGTTDVTLVTPAAETGRLWETTAPLSNSLDRLAGADVTYLVTSVSRDQRAATTNTLGTAGWRVTDSWDFSKVRVLKYERE
jgi:mannosyltransferase